MASEQTSTASALPRSPSPTMQDQEPRPEGRLDDRTPGKTAHNGQDGHRRSDMRGPAVVGMRLGFQTYSAAQRAWLEDHIEEAHDYRSTHDDMQPYYREIWAAFTERFPPMQNPPFPEDADMVEAYNLSKGKDAYLCDDAEHGFVS
ncbi:hypothetical protein BDZ89DRAFT_1147223 [Hymenopellis radicata]|nr:hypothetical protein BDZ89DRAFT_1147223 [Hymenopellis radicata]